MSEREFCYWLKGFFELLDAGPKTSSKYQFTVEQTEMIEKHLRSVFQEKIMNPVTETIQKDLSPPYTITCKQGTLPMGGVIC